MINRKKRLTSSVLSSVKRWFISTITDDTVDSMTELKRTHNKYEEAFEQALDAMYILNDDARFVHANPQAASLYGPEQEALRGQSIADYLPDDFDFETVWTNLQTTGRNRGTATIVTATGKERTVKYSATADIIPGQHLVIARDSTERAGREAQLAQAETVFQHSQDANFLTDATCEAESHIDPMFEQQNS